MLGGRNLVKKILLVNVDSRWNMAIRRMYNYFRKFAIVKMMDLNLSGYPHNKFYTIDGSKYDEVYVSNIFDINKDAYEVVECKKVFIGGIGSNSPKSKLAPEIEQTDPYYFTDEKVSYGFITRGCIRNCYFCKVPKYEGGLCFYNSVESIIKHDTVKFLDNNILAYDKHMEVFQYLIDRGIRCDFNQGLDFRLINDENCKALSELNYIGNYIFAFDDAKYQPLLEEKLVIMKRWIPKEWKIKFYIYCNADQNISEVIDRVEWCRKNKCLPYVMRDINCWDSDNKNFYTDYAAYCNQPGFFKNTNFEEFLKKRTKNTDRIQQELKLYEKYKS